MRPPAKRREPFTAKRTVNLAFALLLGMLLGWGLARVGPASAIGPFAFLSLFAGSIFVHELGHVLAALYVHFQVQSFAVGPFMLQRTLTGVRFRLSPLKFGGLVTIVPVGLHDLRMRMLLMVTGGPAGSFLFAAASVAVGRFLGEPLRSTWMNPFAVISAGMGILALVPMRRFYRSDGAQIFDLLFSPEKAERQCATLAISGAAKTGLRPRDWDGELIAKLLSVPDQTVADVIANSMAYEFALDRREFDLAEAHLESALGLLHKWPPHLKSALAVDAAFYYSMVRRDSSLAHEWLSRCKRHYISSRHVMPMVEAAVLLSDGNSREAAEKAKESLALLPRAQFPGFAAAAKDWLNTILARAESGGGDTGEVNSEQPGIYV